MSSTTSVAPTPKPAVSRQEILQSKHGKIILTVDLLKQIKYHHEQVGAKEWCGILFYKHVEGEFDNPETLVFEATDFYLMDIGREAYTEADMDSDSIIDKWETLNRHYPEGDPQDNKFSDFKSGLIHTHHNMGAFFSATDMSELRESTPAHNYYVSLIVNFNGSYVAKVAFIAKRRISLGYKGTKDEEKSFVEETEVLMMIDLDIIKEQEEVAIPDFFRQRFAAVKKQGEERTKAAAAKYTTPTTNVAPGRTKFSQPNPQEEAWQEYYDSLGPEGQEASGGTLIGGAKPDGNSVQGVVGKQTPVAGTGLATSTFSKLELEVTEAILGWLVEGCELFSDMLPKGRFSSIAEALRFFEDYFDMVGHSSQECKYFIQKMQLNMDMFSKYHPKTVERLGTEAMITCAYNENASIAVELHTLFESYPMYINEVKKTVAGDTKKTRKEVHARKRY